MSNALVRRSAGQECKSKGKLCHSVIVAFGHCVPRTPNERATTGAFGTTEDGNLSSCLRTEAVFENVLCISKNYCSFVVRQDSPDYVITC